MISYESDPTVANFTRQCTGASATTGAAISRSCAALVAGASPPPAPQCSGAHVVTDPAGDAINPPGAAGDTSTADIADVSFSNDNTAKTLTTTMTISNLQLTPMAGTTFTTYYAVWTAPDGKIYATSANVPDPTGQFSYSYGTFDPTTNQIVTAGTGATGTATTGTNGTISVTVPYSGVGNPVIPVQTDANAAVKNPYALTIAVRAPPVAVSSSTSRRTADQTQVSGLTGRYAGPRSTQPSSAQSVPLAVWRCSPAASSWSASAAAGVPPRSRGSSGGRAGDRHRGRRATHTAPGSGTATEV